MGLSAELIGKLIKAAADYVDRCLPEYDPGKWNDDTGVRKCNNCYNYGCDIRTDTFAQPGHASGIILNWPSDMNCEAVTAGAVADGLEKVDCDQGCGCSECRHQVALVIDPGWDYHWYRKDRDGKWSHKPGGTPATNLDNSLNIITDPRTANRGGYTVFCGCFCVNKEKVSIAGPKTDCADQYADVGPAPPQIIATIGLFSGRPNPELALEPEAARELGKLAAADRGAEASPPPPPVLLGEYYGIEVRTPAELSKELALPQRFTVRGGVLTERVEGVASHRLDTAGVERLVLEQAETPELKPLLERMRSRSERPQGDR